MLTVDGIEFSDWLNDQMNARGWRAVDLANAANLPSATIVRILNGDRNAGPDAAVKIAKALGLSPEHVFRQAGLLPPETGAEFSPSLQELNDILKNASEADRREIAEYALWYLRRRNRKQGA